MSGFVCSECGFYTAEVDEYGQQIKREYAGNTVCVSCYSDPKLEHGEYKQ